MHKDMRKGTKSNFWVTCDTCHARVNARFAWIYPNGTVHCLLCDKKILHQLRKEVKK